MPLASAAHLDGRVCTLKGRQPVRCHAIVHPHILGETTQAAPSPQDKRAQAEENACLQATPVYSNTALALDSVTARLSHLCQAVSVTLVGT